MMLNCPRCRMLWRDDETALIGGEQCCVACHIRLVSSELLAPFFHETRRYESRNERLVKWKNSPVYAHFLQITPIAEFREGERAYV